MDTDKDQTEDKQPEEFQDLTKDSSNTPQSDSPDLETVQTEEPEPPPMERSHKKKFWIASLIAILILAGIGFFLTQRKEASPVGETPQPTTSPTLSPSPTPETTFNRAEWSLEVLNGTGVTGAAKKLADKLAQLGYKIVKVGNADRSDYDKSQLFVLKERTDLKDLLLNDLNKEISIASVSGELKDSTASARIIIGQQ